MSQLYHNPPQMMGFFLLSLSKPWSTVILVQEGKFSPSHLTTPESPRTEDCKLQMIALPNQIVFIEHAVKYLYKVGKEIDWMLGTGLEKFMLI